MTTLFYRFFHRAQAAGVQVIGAPVPSQSRKIFEGDGLLRSEAREQQRNVFDNQLWIAIDKD